MELADADAPWCNCSSGVVIKLGIINLFTMVAGVRTPAEILLKGFLKPGIQTSTNSTTDPEAVCEQYE